MEDPGNEIDEIGEQGEENEQRDLDQATFEPDETIEQRYDYQMSEAIESGFNQLMDASHLDTGESPEIDLEGGQEGNSDHLPVERVAKIDSFTWKLQVANDEVGEFRTPSLHGEPIVDIPDPGTPNPAGEPIVPILQTGADDSQQKLELGSRDINDTANIVLGAAVGDTRQDVEDLKTEHDTVGEAKQKIANQLRSPDSVELEGEPASDLQMAAALGDEVGLVGGSEVDKPDDAAGTQARYGEAESEPEVRVDPASNETIEDAESSPGRDQDSARDEE